MFCVGIVMKIGECVCYDGGVGGGDFNIIPFKVVPFGINTPVGAVLPPLEAFCWNFLPARSFLVSFIALWMLTIVLICCPRRQFVILGKRKKSCGEHWGCGTTTVCLDIKTLLTDNT